MLGQVLTNVADLSVRERRFEQAAAALDEARALLVAEYGDELAGAAAWRLAVLDSVAGFYEIERGRFLEAEKHLTAAWTVLRARFGARSYFGDQCLVHLSRLYEIQGKSRAAHNIGRCCVVSLQPTDRHLFHPMSIDPQGLSIDSMLTSCRGKQAPQGRSV